LCVSILIVNWNGKNLLEDCLKSIQHQNYPQNQIEIILIDNGSTDGSYEFIREKFPHVKIIRLKKNYGFPKASNFGIKAAKCKYIGLVNNDVILNRNWIAKLVEIMEKDRKILIESIDQIEAEKRKTLEIHGLTNNGFDQPY
jgi:GT2 family glycosyltransferase